jgi:hypothetical protein
MKLKDIWFERAPCTRCGGSGKYSFNKRDGDRCFGCHGVGNPLTEWGLRAKKAWDAAKLQHLSVAFEDIVPNRGYAFLRSRRFTKYITVHGTHICPLNNVPMVETRRPDGTPVHSQFSAGEVMRQARDDEERAEIVATFEESMRSYRKKGYRINYESVE